uniref:Cas system-associated protein n=1 Tax=Siphoviridae sp. ctTwu10 TaxID=2825525 RepID=A0A8S5P889_9CAUD|nr:MAG TPA: Cas system-associated protein [Siphoviridae sp. ctTwu10]
MCNGFLVRCYDRRKQEIIKHKLEPFRAGIVSKNPRLFFSAGVREALWQRLTI